MALITSIMRAGANSHQTTSEEANSYATDFVSEGIIGSLVNTSGVAPATGGFAVNASGTPDANINISAGVAYVTGTPTSQNSQMFRVKNTATTTLAISANSSGSTKYDWIYIKLDATLLNDPNTAGDSTATIVASRSSSASSDDGTPPTYGYPIAVVTVANGFTTLANSVMRDIRTTATISATAAGTSQDWYATGAVPSTVTYLGNRSYTLLFSAVDLTGYISNGMRLKLARTVAAPTQCTSLNGTNQYYSKTAPAGMTFTDDFVAGAWVKVSSYAAGTIVSRANGTQGWVLNMNASGQIRLSGFNASLANSSYVQSYQSVPLNKWVYIASQLDMSAFTATTTTSYVMIDGVDAPAFVTRTGTNPTALVQAGDLQVGAYNGATEPFPGKIAQAFVTSAKVTQANIRTIYSQSITTTDITNLNIISAYSFNNSIADLNTTNANNLTANGSAVATNADSPFAGGSVGTNEYAIVTANTFSTNTTLTVQVPEGYAIPTSGGVSTVSYSTQKVPYGFPSDVGKWRVESVYKTDAIQSSPVTNTWYNLGSTQLTIPVGAWRYGYETVLYISRGNSSGTVDAHVTISTANNTETDPETSSEVYLVAATSGGAMETASGQRREKPLTTTSQAVYYLNAKSASAGGTSLAFLASSRPAIKFYTDPTFL